MGRPAEIRTSASMARRLLEARLMQTQPTCLAQAMTWNEDQNNQIHETDMAVMAGGASLTCRLRRTDFRDLEVSTASEVAIAQKIDQLKHLSLPPMSAVEAREFFSWSQPRGIDTLRAAVAAAPEFLENMRSRNATKKDEKNDN